MKEESVGGMAGIRLEWAEGACANFEKQNLLEVADGMITANA